MAALEGGEAGLACATGMAGIATALVAERRAGDHPLASRSLYGATTRLIREELSRLGIQSDFVDATNAAVVARALRPETRVLFVETLSNPLLELADLEALGDLCRERGVR